VGQRYLSVSCQWLSLSHWVALDPCHRRSRSRQCCEDEERSTCVNVTEHSRGVKASRPGFHPEKEEPRRPDQAARLLFWGYVTSRRTGRLARGRQVGAGTHAHAVDATHRPLLPAIMRAWQQGELLRWLGLVTLARSDSAARLVAGDG
jgi:hypothetical protein